MDARIVEVETHTSEDFPHLLHVVIRTSDGLEGLGETYHHASAVAEYIHSVAAPVLIGQESLNTVALTRLAGSRFNAGNPPAGTATIDSSAASAIDIALWDLRAKALGIPLAEALGGRVRDRIPVYNTCVGYGFHSQPGTTKGSDNTTRFGLGGPGGGPFEDFDAMWLSPAELAKNLIAEGYCAMKVFTFNPAARETGGTYITPAQIEHAIAPIRAIREAVGMGIDIMVDLNFMWALAPCMRIVSALEEFNLLWIEDPLWWGARRHHAALAKQTRTPIAAFDYASGTESYLEFIEREGVAVFRVDPQWAGGVSEAIRIAALASTVGIGVVFHDCTGPVQFAVSTHLAVHTSNAMMQESARAYWRTIYPRIVDSSPEFVGGEAAPAGGNGHGAMLLPEYVASPTTRTRTTAAAS